MHSAMAVSYTIEFFANPHFQVKEELEGNPDFFKPHSVAKEDGAVAS